MSDTISRMSYHIVGLGNPGDAYENTRHNAGRMIAHAIHAACGTDNWDMHADAHVLLAHGVVAGVSSTFILPEGYMNRSGASVAALISPKEAETHLIVLYDDLDLAIGSFKLAYDRGSGGHKGVQSIIDALGTKAFLRVRIGISPTTMFGTLKKPQGEEAVHKHIMSAFTAREQRQLMDLVEPITDALSLAINEGREKAMNLYN